MKGVHIDLRNLLVFVSVRHPINFGHSVYGAFLAHAHFSRNVGRPVRLLCILSVCLCITFSTLVAINPITKSEFHAIVGHPIATLSVFYNTTVVLTWEVQATSAPLGSES